MSVVTEGQSVEFRPMAVMQVDRLTQTASPDSTPHHVPSVLAGVSACVGVLSVSGADIRSRAGTSGSYGLFWLGLALIFVPAAWQLCRRNTPRNERIVLAVVVGVALYLVKCLYSPTAFVFHDEFAHLRTVIDLRNTGQLFGFNPEIRVAADYPGLALVTLSLAKVSGLSLVTSGMVIIGAGRLLLMLALFLLLERLTGSARAAGIGCLIYAGNANFLYWSAQFAYESLALPLAFAVAYLVLRRSDGTKRELIPVLLVAAMVVITHHLTAYALFGLLAAWSVVALIRRRHGRPDDYVPLVPALLVGVGAGLWLGLVAPRTLGYLLPVIGKAVTQGVDLLVHGQASRVLFATPHGPVQPEWELAVALASVLLILVFLPLGLMPRGRRQAHPLRVLAWTSVLYVLMLPLRFTAAGQEAANRSGEFFFVGIGIVFATLFIGKSTAVAHARTRGFMQLSQTWHRARGVQTLTAFVVCMVMFAGGVAVSWNFGARLPPRQRVTSVPLITTADDTVAARWFLREYGPNQRIATDITTGFAFATAGDQNILSGASDGAHVWRIFFPSTMTPSVYGELAGSKVQFIVVQKQLTEGFPPSSVVPIFDAGEPAVDDSRPLPVASQQKFVTAAGVSMVYQSRTIIIYRIDHDVARSRAGLT